MEKYLKTRVGSAVGVIRAGMPKEIYFEATLKEVTPGAAVFEDEKGGSFAVSLDKILMCGDPQTFAGQGRSKVGFV